MISLGTTEGLLLFCCCFTVITAPEILVLSQKGTNIVSFGRERVIRARGTMRVVDQVGRMHYRNTYIRIAVLVPLQCNLWHE